MILYIGKKFKIISKGISSNVEIIDIKDKFIIALINGAKFRMNKQELLDKFSDYEIEKNEKNMKKCKNCIEYKNGNCIGESKICEDFRLAPIISKSEIENWPKNGSVSKSKSDNFFIREYDEMYNKYHEVYH